MGIKDWFFKKTEHDLTLEALKKEEQVQDAKLKATTKSDLVIRGVEYNELVAAVTKNCRTEQDREDALRRFFTILGGDYEDVAKELKGKYQLKLLDQLTPEKIQSVREIYELRKKNKGNALGFDGFR